MKAQVFIIRGSKAKLQAAYRLLGVEPEIRSLTIYKIGARFRMMVGGWLPLDKVSSIIKDESLKITNYTPK